ncbi:hypothetical protein H4Q26_015994 [Puccinia striiformis f. sp. tritici PST-130]|nr:hypothetical protein H4Q26_015994 [Puccinia striiformis f. sp. tritici PST-130]
MANFGQGSAQEQKTLNKHVNVQADHYKLIREIGAASAILLKNVNHTLPLKSPKEMRSVLVIGSDAGDNPQGVNSCVARACNNGTLAAAWGSGSANFPYLVSPATAIQKYLTQDNPSITYQSILDNYAYKEVADACKEVDVAIVHVSSDSGEGYIPVAGNAGDRNNISLWYNVDMESWIDNKNVTAVVLAGLPGQETGNSEVDVCGGKSIHLQDYRIPSQRNTQITCPSAFQLGHESTPNNLLRATEDRLQTFRPHNIQPRFEFGFVESGLLWTVCYVTGASLYDNLVKVQFRVTNTGTTPGHEVAQVVAP